MEEANRGVCFWFIGDDDATDTQLPHLGVINPGERFFLLSYFHSPKRISVNNQFRLISYTRIGRRHCGRWKLLSDRSIGASFGVVVFFFKLISELTPIACLTHAHARALTENDRKKFVSAVLPSVCRAVLEQFEASAKSEDASANVNGKAQN